MDTNLKDFAVEIIRETSKPPPRMETSKKIMWVAAMLAIGTFIVSTISWFIWREFPTELIQFTTWFCSTVGVSYMGKTAYENKPKILNGLKRNGGESR